MADRSIVVAGVGHAEGVGAAVARKFAREGFAVTILGRNEEKLKGAEASIRAITPEVTAVVGDVTDRETVERAVVQADTAKAPLEVAVFNAGGNWPSAYLDMEPAFLENMWRAGAYAGFVFSAAATERMLPRGRGTIIFTGATASMRGRAKFAAFASSKAALRALAQSAAREFGPQGLHIAHVVIDGAVDGDRIRSLLPRLKEQRGPDGLLKPDDIALAYWFLYQQPRSAWTHELDLRPWSEPW